MKSRNNLFLMIAIVFALIFAGVVFMTAGSLGTSIDEGLANWADGKNETVLASIMKVASIIGSSEVIMLITVAIGLYFLMRRHWRHFFFFFVLSVGGVILNLALKMFIQRTHQGDEAELMEVFNYNFDLNSYVYSSVNACSAWI